MKTHWYILIGTIVAGTVMFFIFFEFPNKNTDQIRVHQDNIKDYRLFIGNLTDSIYYDNGNFYGRNADQFKEYLIPESGKLACTLFVQNTIILTYQDKYFYDVPLTKNENETGYRIDFKIAEDIEESKHLEAILKKNNKAFLLMNGNMMPMYNKFEMYIKDQLHRNIRVTEDPVSDSLSTSDSLTNDISL